MGGGAMQSERIGVAGGGSSVGRWVRVFVE